MTLPQGEDSVYTDFNNIGTVVKLDKSSINSYRIPSIPC